MTVRIPEDMNKAFAEAYSSGDIEQLLDLYEPEAILAPQVGKRAVGLEAIRAALTELIGLGGGMRSENKLCMPFDDIAMLRAEFHLSGAGEDGDVEMR